MPDKVAIVRHVHRGIGCARGASACRQALGDLLGFFVLMACLSGLAHAQSDLIEGTWALGTSCSGFLYETRIRGDLWEFTDSDRRTSVERLLRSEPGTYLTETVSGGDLPRGTRWLYTFKGLAAIDVRNLGSGRSFGLTRCSPPPGQPAPRLAATATVPAPQPGATTVVQQQQVNNTTNNTVVVNLTNDASEARALISMFKAIIQEQRKLAAGNADMDEVAKQSIEVLEPRVKELEARFLEKTTELSRYRTSIRPNDPDLQITARRASETFPKIPYYIPGTSKSGEFWFEPKVADKGEPVFYLRFINPDSQNNKTRNSILLTISEAE